MASKDQRPVCRHCKCKVANRPRGLCWGCSNQPGIREQYPVAAGGYPGRDVGGGRVPREPTHHPPGSEGKIRVMMERFARRESLFHDDDAKLQPGGTDDE